LRVIAKQPAEAVVGDPVEEVGGIGKRPCRTPQQFTRERASIHFHRDCWSNVLRDSIHFLPAGRGQLCGQCGLGVGQHMLREAAAVGSLRTCIAFISLGDGRANVQSIHFHPNHWSRAQLNSDLGPAGTHRNREGANCGRFERRVSGGGTRGESGSARPRIGICFSRSLYTLV
jgi:hypothetical protein